VLQEGKKEIIICDNSGTDDIRFESLLTAEPVCRYVDTSGLLPQTCYHGLEVGPEGDWLCWPSDDSYYVPQFQAIMLDYACKNRLEFVYCNCLYDPRLKGEYAVQGTQPGFCGIDKTSFIVTRRAFEEVGGWPQHKNDWRDGALAVALVKSGIKHGKAPGVLVVHN
jgi:hypothetical protein